MADKGKEKEGAKAKIKVSVTIKGEPKAREQAMRLVHHGMSRGLRGMSSSGR